MLLNVLSVLSIIWLLTLSIVFYLTFVHYKKLSDGAKLGGINDQTKKVLDELANEVKKLERDGQFHLQKVGLVRFNPFGDTGGDNSFSLSLLDGQLNGIVITGLHARERTRVYVKPIQAGKGRTELSKEEVKAIEAALRT
jgi:hypothetical protein